MLEQVAAKESTMDLLFDDSATDGLTNAITVAGLEATANLVRRT